MLIKVVAALIEKDNKVLIAKRSTGDPNVYGKWEFPGGKVELNEDEFYAIEREIFEEFELKIKAKEFIINNICEYPTKTVDLRLYSCDYISGEFKLHDHSEIAWVNKDELLNYDLAPADIPLAEYIKELNEMNCFDRFMRLYPINDKVVNSSKEYFGLLKSIALNINKQYNNKYFVKASCGQTNLADVPWICIFNKNITTKAEKGVYACILFRADMKGFYLGLGQGQQFFKDSFGMTKGLEYLSKVSDYFRRQVKINTFNLKEIDLNVGKGSRGEGFEKANIISKYYESGNYTLNELNADLSNILTIYDEIAEFISISTYDEIIKNVINNKEISLDYINEENQKMEQEILKHTNLSYGEITSLIEVSIPEKKKRLTLVSQKMIRKVDGIEKAKHDSIVGLIGEELVLEYEKKKMRDNGREDLVDKVIWESRINDQLGYDIRSYNFDENGKEKEIFIEVKTTDSNIKNAFFISKNEYEKFELYKDKYWIYRVSSQKNVFYKINYDEFNEKFNKEVYNYVIEIKTP